MRTERSVLTFAICLALAAPGCATSTAAVPQTAPQVSPAYGRGLMAAYVQQLPVGSRIRATLADGRRLRGTLMQVTSESVAVLPRTRLPEPPVEVPMDTIVSLELDTSSNVARTIAIGVGAGVAAALGVLAILAAVLAD